MSDQEEKVPRLAAKLAAVMEAVERIPKRGTNEHFNYKFATETDIVAAIRVELAKHHVALVPSVLGCDRELIDEKTKTYNGETKVSRKWLTTIRMRFTFYDGESNDTITREWMGCGSDGDDKGLYKAMTGGEKYFLLKTFLIPTGDDPEASEPRDRQDRRARGGQSPTPRSDTSGPPRTESPSAMPSTGASSATISEPMRKRMFAIANEHGWKTDEVKSLLKRHGFDSSSQVTKSAYDSICTALQEGVSGAQEQTH